MKLNITVERVAHNGHLILSTMERGELIRQTYIGYTESEAREAFTEHVAERIGPYDAEHTCEE